MTNLQAKRLLDQTLVVLGTEFGHTPRINANDWRAAVVDQTMIAIRSDLHTKGLLAKTLVVLGTEFGRTPRISDNDGRDHHNALRCLGPSSFPDA